MLEKVLLLSQIFGFVALVFYLYRTLSDVQAERIAALKDTVSQLERDLAAG